MIANDTNAVNSVSALTQVILTYIVKDAAMERAHGVMFFKTLVSGAR